MMRKVVVIARREISERLSNRSFWLLAFFGPVFLVLLLLALFRLGGEEDQHWRILIADPAQLLDNKIAAGNTGAHDYFFINDYVETQDFHSLPKFATYDALVEINEKVLSNKLAFVFYRKKPSARTQIDVKFQVEQRIEEVLAEQSGKLTLSEFRQIKKPIHLAYRDVADPTNQAPEQSGWVGLAFGGIIVLFIFLFGMSVMHSVTREKSNRIVEILVATVKPSDLLAGKILGVGATALIQFLFWFIVAGVGLGVLRTYVYPDFQQSAAAGDLHVYNEYVSLVFERLNFAVILPWFLVFFVLAYLFYGSLFAALGAVGGSESDGQQYSFPVLIVLLLALYSGYHAIYYPDSLLTAAFQYFPFTAPVVIMVRLAQGFAPGESWQLFAVLIVQVVFVGLALLFAAKLYKNSLLRFGQNTKFRHIISLLLTK